MKSAIVSSVCECQARLGAELDEDHNVVHGWSRDVRGRTENSPCTRASNDGNRFHLAWLCPFCGRNTLRSFDVQALAFRDPAEPETRPSTRPSSRPSARPPSP